MNDKGSNEKIKFNAVFSLIIGIISIFGLIFIKEGTFLSIIIVGLIWGLMSLKESNVKQTGRKLALVAIAFNLIGLIGVITLTV